MKFPVFDLHCDTALALLGESLNEAGNLRIVHIKSVQRNEMNENRPMLKKLIEKLNCKPLYFDDKDSYIITEE